MSSFSLSRFQGILLVFFLLGSLAAHAQAPPTISSISLLSAEPGSNIKITGTGFNTTAENNIVWFGGVKVPPGSVSVNGTQTELTVTVPTGATFGPVTVTDITTNLTAYSKQFFFPSLDANAAKTSLLPVDLSPQPQLYTSISGHRTLPGSLASGDLDGDGKPDLVVSSVYGPADGGPANVFSILKNNAGTGGNLSFAGQIDITIPAGITIPPGTGSYNRLSNASLADFDGDGMLDIAIVAHEVVVNSGIVTLVAGTTKLFVYRNTGTLADFETATPAGPFALPDAQIQSIAVTDMNADGKPDVVTANGNNMASDRYSVLINNGTGTIDFDTQQSFDIGSNLGLIYVADMDGDGKPDIVAPHYSSNTVFVSLNATADGDHSYTPGTTTPVTISGAGGGE